MAKKRRTDTKQTNGMMRPGQDTTWETPKIILDAVRAVAPIDLDPATSSSNPCKAKRFFTPKQNGLKQPWTSKGLVFCNPPYGRGLLDWACMISGASTLAKHVIALVPARPDTRWWSALMARRPVICFVTGRLKFGGATEGAQFPSAVLYYGPANEKFIKVFGAIGRIYAQV